MNKTFPTLLAMAAMLLAGCLSNMPRITTQPKEDQETQARLEALKHWQEMAEQVASELAANEQLFESGEKIYVNKSEFETPFANAFYKLLLTALHNEEVPVTNNADTELNLQFSVQNVRHEKEEVGGAARVVEDFGISVNQFFTGSSGNIAGPESEEILVFTTLSNTEEDVFVLSQIAYINRSESHFYLEQEIEKPKSLGTQSYRVINEKNI